MISMLTQVFFLISSGLLVPVMAILLWGLLSALWLTGQTIRMAFVRQTRRTATVREFQSILKSGVPTRDDVLKLPASGPAFQAIREISEKREDLLWMEKRVADFEAFGRERLAPIQLLIKFGPALGLMGTLIPLGPALIGLASGEIQTMAQNLVIAFATTVVGLLVSLIALFLHGVRKRWLIRDQILVTFFAARLAEASSKESDK